MNCTSRSRPSFARANATTPRGVIGSQAVRGIVSIASIEGGDAVEFNPKARRVRTNGACGARGRLLPITLPAWFPAAWDSVHPQTAVAAAGRPKPARDNAASLRRPPALQHNRFLEL